MNDNLLSLLLSPDITNIELGLALAESQQIDISPLLNEAMVILGESQIDAYRLSKLNKDGYELHTVILTNPDKIKLLEQNEGQLKYFTPYSIVLTQSNKDISTALKNFSHIQNLAINTPVLDNVKHISFDHLDAFSVFQNGYNYIIPKHICKNLKTINLSYSTPNFECNCPNVTKLTINSYLEIGNCQYIKKLPNLEEINFNGFILDKQVIQLMLGNVVRTENLFINLEQGIIKKV